MPKTSGIAGANAMSGLKGTMQAAINMILRRAATTAMPRSMNCPEAQPPMIVPAPCRQVNDPGILSHPNQTHGMLADQVLREPKQEEVPDGVGKESSQRESPSVRIRQHELPSLPLGLTFGIRGSAREVPVFESVRRAPSPPEDCRRSETTTARE